MAVSGKSARPMASVVTGIAAVWLLLAPVLGHMGPPWPCAAIGAFLLVAAIMVVWKPAQARGWGVLIIVVSGATVLLGSDAFVPAFIGVVGGLTAVATAPSTAKPTNQ